MHENQNSTTTKLLNFFSRRPIRFSRFFARALAVVINTLKITKTSQNMSLNIDICLPYLNQTQKNAIVRSAVRNELQSYMEFFSIWGSSNEKNIGRIKQVFGEKYFHQAMDENKGIILLAPHFGTWEIMNAWFAQYTQMTIMYKPIKNPEADQFVRQARSREQATLVPTDESGIRQIFKALKMGGTTVILPDHTPKHTSELIDYFGLPLASSNLSAKLIQKTKAKALLVYAIRNETEDFNIHIEPVDDAVYHGTATEGTLVIHRAIEGLIQRYPEHAHWSYKRFRAHPDLHDIYDIPKDQALDKIQKIRENSLCLTTPSSAS